jgi:carbonic anhydrase
VASLEFSVRVLGSVFLVVLGHSDCGAVRNAISLAHGEASFPPAEFGQIGKLLEKIVPAVKIADGQPGVTPLLQRATNANAILMAQALTQVEPILAPAVRSGALGVAAAYFDIPSGVATGLWSSFPLS